MCACMHVCVWVSNQNRTVYFSPILHNFYVFLFSCFWLKISHSQFSLFVVVLVFIQFFFWFSGKCIKLQNHRIGTKFIIWWNKWMDIQQPNETGSTTVRFNYCNLFFIILIWKTYILSQFENNHQLIKKLNEMSFIACFTRRYSVWN